MNIDHWKKDTRVSHITKPEWGGRQCVSALG